MRRTLAIGLIWLILLSPGVGSANSRGFILLASTIGPIDSGIVDLLENEFEKETGIRVRHVGAGTGAALDIAKKGNVDLVMVHAQSLEEKFVHEGFGTERIDLMYNDFVIVGPAGDPAGIQGMKSAPEAFKRISEKQVIFVTRGDRSGTHVAEMEIWRKAGIKPQGSWYYTCERGAEGNVPTLRHTDKMQAYTYMDRATYLSLKNQIRLVILVEKDETMLNFISLIPVNSQKFPRVNREDTMKFIRWLASPEKGQKIIEDFGRDKYRSPLFFPNSKEWRETKGFSK